MIKQLTNSTCYALSLPPSLLDQDMTCVKNCDNPDPKTHEHFEQPIWQTLNMFMGEILCLVAASIFAFLAEKYGRAKWADLILDAEEDDILAVIESDCLLSSPTPAYGHGHGHGNGHAAPLKKKLEGPLVLLLWLPTLCDMTASTVRNTTSLLCSPQRILIGCILSLSYPFFFCLLRLDSKTLHPPFFIGRTATSGILEWRHSDLDLRGITTATAGCSA